MGNKNTATTETNLVFYINGKRFELTNPDPSMLLFDFIHDHTPFKGTKMGCGEGGCGACAVTVSRWDAERKIVVTRSANSCLKPLVSCHGLSITTVEGLCGTDSKADEGKSNHPVADRLHKLHGSQCGYCTPGMVMAIYAALQKNSKPSEKEMESCVDGNICRCTGYRPILDTAKSFATDSKVVDHIRHAVKAGPYDRTKDPVFPEALKTTSAAEEALFEAAAGKKTGWIRATSLARVSELLSKVSKSDRSARFVVSDTCLGVYKNPPAVDVKIDVKNVPELAREPKIESGGKELVLGAATSLTDLMDVLEANRDVSETFGPLAEHIRKVANAHVRNQASVGGNLVMARTMGFLSDIAPILWGAGALLEIYDAGRTRKVRTVDLDTFFEDRASFSKERGDLIVTVRIPVVNGKRSVFRSYRSAIRPINCHAIANAAMCATFQDGGTVVEDARIVFNGLHVHDDPNSTPLRARKTETFLKGKCVVDRDVYGGALKVLSDELGDLIEAAEQKMHSFTDKSFGVVSRKTLVRSFFTKFVVACASSRGATAKIDPIYRFSEVDLADRCVVESKQEFPKAENAPNVVHRPLPNQTAHLQVAGKATYVGDIVHRKGTGYACLVAATIANGKLGKIDTSTALKASGVIGWIAAEDVPGKNSGSALGEPYPFPASAFPQYTAPWLFVPVGEKVGHYGQAIGLVVARSRAEAFAAAKLIRVSYEDVKKPVLSIEDGLKKSPGGPCPDLSGNGLPTQVNMKTGDVDAALKAAGDKVVRGAHRCGSQKHFYIETQSAYAYFTEGGDLCVHSSNQWPQAVHDVVASVMGMAQHKINVVCRRIGGGYGGKLVFAAPVAAMVSVASRKFGIPIAFQVDRNRDSMAVGGREEMAVKYEAAYRPSDGLITALAADNLVTGGHCVSLSWFANVSFSQALSEAYGFEHCRTSSKMVFTNKAPRSAVRGPGEIQASTAVETVIEHVAHAAGISAHEVRKRNILRHPGAESATIEKIAESSPPSDPEKCGKIPGSGKPATNFTIPKMWVALEKSADYAARAAGIDRFNAQNFAKKRGIAMVPIRYAVNVWKKSALVCIYKDGTVLVRHGAQSMGQGCNIKIAQAAASVLGTLLGETFPLDRINFASFESSVLSAQTFTGGSTGTEGAAKAAMKACQKLVDSFVPIRDALKKKASEEAATKNSSSGNSTKESDVVADVAWASVCAAAEQANLPMQALGQHGGEKSDDKLEYNCYGVGCSEIELDTLTGEILVRRTDIMYDAGKSMNPMVDIGQSEGAFVMGLGFVTQEEVCFDESSGKLLGEGTWEYKPPMAFNIPRVFNVTLMKNEGLKNHILSSKASGEPPLVLASTVLMALRQAIASCRKDAGMTDFFELNPPATTETILNLLAPAVAKMSDCFVHA
eukprot:g1680.t1